MNLQKPLCRFENAAFAVARWLIFAALDCDPDCDPVSFPFERSTGFGEATSDFLVFQILDNTAGSTITVEPTLPKQYVKQELNWTAIVREGFGHEASEHLEVTATLKEFPNQPDPVKRTPGIIMIVPISDDGYGAYPRFDYED